MAKLQLMEMGLRIRKRREELKLTQEKAAELIDISETHYKNIECGRKKMSMELFMKICEVFQMDQTYVLTGKSIGNNPIIKTYEDLPEEKRKFFDEMMSRMQQLIEK